MLVLSRKQNQEIIIGDNIKITVLKMKGNTVRIGIDAPQDIAVRRGELQKLESQNRSPTPKTAVAKENEDSKYTVVFSNSNETNSPQADVIPFASLEPCPETKPKSSDRLDQPSGQSSTTIQFRGQLPESFQNNRLKEIVSRLTTGTKANSSETPIG